MTIAETVKQGLHYARTCKSLWLFGFFVAATSGGSSGSGGGNGGGISVGAGGIAVSGDVLARASGGVILIVLAVLVLAAAGLVMRFISEGALIEGVVRARQGGRLSTREGFRAGLAHLGVLVRIAIVYFAATVGSLALFAAPSVFAYITMGPVSAIVAGLVALAVAVPWLVTLYLVQAFASQIAVLENRRAMDAIRKARLFLHGRLMHGLKLIVATFIGTLIIAVLGFAMIAPVALVLVALAQVVNVFLVIVAGCALLVPALAVMAAMIGTLRSSVWTIGYVTEMES